MINCNLVLLQELRKLEPDLVLWSTAERSWTAGAFANALALDAAVWSSQDSEGASECLRDFFRICLDKCARSGKRLAATPRVLAARNAFVARTEPTVLLLSPADWAALQAESPDLLDSTERGDGSLVGKFQGMTVHALDYLAGRILIY